MPERGPRLDWAAFYLDGRTAARRGATIRLARTVLEASVDGGETLRWPYDEIRQTQGFHAGEPVRLEHGDGIAATLVVLDTDFLASLRQVAGTDVSRFRRADRRWTGIVIGSVMGALVLAVVLYRWGIPAAAQAIAAVVPVSWEDGLGASVVDRLAPPRKRCREAGGQRALEKLLGRLTAADPSPYRFRIVVLDDRSLNAFAAPGGHLVVLRGLLDRTHTPEELAGVLAHETQHVLRRHATRAIIERASTGLLVAALVGDLSGLIAFAAENASALAYSRQHEQEADADGIRLLVAAGLDPAGMIAFYETIMAEESRAPKAVRYLSTHPSAEDRLARLRTLIGTLQGPARTPALTDGEWQALRAICVGRA